ncbi:MAG TPA: polysaccharide deacetylase family protein [Bacillales bacterium]|nr:polysaccharide deacetylase family protein [Bacillales bacterium]
MKFIWVINGKKLKQTLLIVTSALIAASIAFVNTKELPAFSTSTGPHAISKVQTKKKQVALTFNIGWGEVQVEPILKTLKDRGVQATFFVSGSWAEHHPEIAKKIVQNHNEIASHGFGHKDYRSMEQADLRNDILLARNAIKKASGETPSLLRPPNGSFNAKVLKMAADLNCTVIDSSLNSRDVSDADAEEIVRNIVKKVSPGDILLLHASDSARQTPEALPVILEKLKDKGYSFMTVTELLNNADTRSNLVK